MECQAHEDGSWWEVDVHRTRAVVGRVPHLEVALENGTYERVGRQDLGKRLRLSARQCQDDECEELQPGVTVSVACHFEDDTFHYYDARICGVQRRPHKRDGTCRCKFMLMWHDGHADSREGVQDICLLQEGVERHRAYATWAARLGGSKKESITGRLLGLVRWMVPGSRMSV